MFLHVCSNSKVKLGPLSRAAPKEKNSETRAPGFIDLLQEHRLLKRRRAGSGDQGVSAPPAEGMSQELGRRKSLRSAGRPFHRPRTGLQNRDHRTPPRTPADQPRAE